LIYQCITAIAAVSWVSSDQKNHDEIPVVSPLVGVKHGIGV